MLASVNPGLRLVRALDDPLRYELVMRLFAGPATVSELVAASGAAQSKVSNHLAILRDAEVVSTERMGRAVVYAVADPAIAAVVEALEHACGGARAAIRTAPELAVARSCYDHLAGRLGVAVYDALVARRALHDVNAPTPARKVRGAFGAVELGPAARGVFAQLDIDLDAVMAQRRQFATACSDWTESRAHLGGALGAALQERLLRERWVLRRGGTRALRITDRGRAGLRERFGIEVDALGR
ncbi:MAG TPA: metalloregulator ArsR/SmtB family transcription factor [Candidatus Sulfotelmatobacter sp.]|nr:metalloregulator ArsR/SmtB family transcription factor [Candidatus Sulfotelmatobacter sp.]